MKSKIKAMLRNLYNEIPASTPKGKEAHLQIDKRPRTVNRINSFFFQTDGHSATLIENSSNTDVYIFSVLKIQNRSKQEALWTAVIQVTISLETIYTLT